MLLAGVGLAQFDAQLCDLSTQGVEGVGELFRHRTEGEKRCLQFGASAFDQLEFVGCHAGRRKQLLCLGGICSSDQPVTSKSRASQKSPPRAASIFCQAERRYLRSFSTRVVRRMRSSRAASATVPSASSSAWRIRPSSIALRWSFKSRPPLGSAFSSKKSAAASAAQLVAT